MTLAEQRAQRIKAIYEKLSTYAGETLFPRQAYFRNLKDAPWWQQKAVRVALATLPDASFEAGIGISSSAVAFLFGLSVQIALAISQTTANLVPYSVLVWLILASLLTAIPVYTRLVLEQRQRSLRRRHSLIGLVISIVFPAWILREAIALNGLSIHLTSEDYFWSVLVWGLSIIPAIGYWLFQMLDMWRLFRSGYQKVFVYYAPLFTKHIQDLLCAEFSVEGDQGAWSLLTLPSDMLSALRLWAEASREDSLHRTTPIMFLLALAALFTGLAPLQHWMVAFFGGVFQWLFNPVWSWGLVPIFFLLLLVVSFAKRLLELFANIAVQSVLVQALIVAEYATSDIPKPPEQHHKRLWEHVSDFFSWM